MKPIPEEILTAMQAHRLWYESMAKEGKQLWLLDDENLSELDFSGFVLGDTWMAGVNFDGCRFVETDFYASTLASSTFRNADMTGCILRKANMDYTNLHGAILINANITRAQFGEADLTGANLTAARLDGAVFSDTSLVGANLTNASVANSSFDNVDLSDAILTNVRELDEAHIRSIIVHGKRLAPKEARRWMESQIG